MNSVVTISPRAQADLRGIWKYIAKRNLAAADRMMDRFREKFDMLARQPLIGEAREDVAPALREVPVGNYVVFYVPLSDDLGVEIVAVIHGAREIDLVL